MKWMIASDLHGSYFYASQMQQAFEREQADRLLLLGDLLYHGPRNDLPEGYAPKQVMPLLNGMKDRLLCVRGNCDAEVDQMVLEFPVLADYAVLPVGRRLVYATHGHVYNTKTPPPLAPGDILLHGHTHIPAWEPFGQGSLYLNPGSVSLPKEGSAHSYMTLENGCFRLNNTAPACFRSGSGAVFRCRRCFRCSARSSRRCSSALRKHPAPSWTINCWKARSTWPFI